MQGFNRYHPPDYNPEDKAHRGSLNGLAGKKPQSNVVRFEMPFNIWCGHCDRHIAQGVRFNAQKQRVGQYYSSPIWRFLMKCHECTGPIEIETNPKETSYNVVSGGARRNQDWDAQANGSLELGESRDADILTHLESESVKRQSLKQASTQIAQIQAANRRQWSDPYQASQILRRRFREGKKQALSRADQRNQLERRFGFAIDLQDPVPEDTALAKHVAFASTNYVRESADPKARLARRLCGGQPEKAKTKMPIERPGVILEKRQASTSSLVDYCSENELL